MQVDLYSVSQLILIVTITTRTTNDDDNDDGDAAADDDDDVRTVLFSLHSVVHSNRSADVWSASRELRHH